jgi:hypothetical protein
VLFSFSLILEIADRFEGRRRVEEAQMDNWTFGITMLVVGMGGTVAALGLLAVMMNVLKKVFPYKEEQTK